MLSKLSQRVLQTSTRYVSTTAYMGQQLSPKQVFERESKYGAHNYHPLPVALKKGKGNESPLGV